MKTFNENKLPDKTKSMFESHQKWSNNNLKETLKNHHREIEKLLQKIEVFDIWKNILQEKYKNEVGLLIPEIFMDSYNSIHFACLGLYKQANVCLRAQIETALRMVYFSTHPVEFKWWHAGEDWYIKKGDVWGERYEYFKRLEDVKNFEKKCKENNYEASLFNKINDLYKKLSKYVHSGVASFQTTPERYSPNYKISEFKRWMSNFKMIQKYSNTILILGFAEEFKNTSLTRKKRILKELEDNNFKKGIRKSLGLKFRGRI